MANAVSSSQGVAEAAGSILLLGFGADAPSY